jgi:hypothetical protein
MELTMENNEAITKENASSGVIHVLYLFFVTFLFSFTIYADAATITRAAKDIDGKSIQGVLIEGKYIGHPPLKKSEINVEWVSSNDR